MISKIRNILQKLKPGNMSKGVKIRLLVYVVIIIALNMIFFPILEKMYRQGGPARTATTRKTPKSNEQPASVSVASSEPKAFISGGKGLAVIKEGNKKTWEPLIKDTVIKVNTEIAVHKPGDRLLLSIPQNLLFALDGNSAVGLSMHQGSAFSIKILWGCIGLKPYTSNIGKTFLQTTAAPQPVQLEVNREIVYCLDPETGDVSENTRKNDIFIQTGTFESGDMEYRAVFPCGDIIELMQNETQKNINLEINAPFLAKKRVEISNNASFQQLVFYSDGFSDKFTSSALTDGKYYWRVLDSKNIKNSSRICEFEIVKQDRITPVLPQNNDIIADIPVTFSWNRIQGGSGKTYLTIAKKPDMTEVVQKSEIAEGNSLRYDDPYQTFGAGKFFWQVSSGELKSNIRSFNVFNEHDLVMHIPSEGASVSPDENLLLIKWSTLPLVRTYSMIIADNPSFSNATVAYSGKNPFVIADMLPKREYFVKLSALFNNNRKLAGKSGNFSISEIININITSPVNFESYILDAAKAKKMLFPVEWETPEGVSKISFTVNSGKGPVISKPGTISARVRVKKGTNTLEATGFCGSADTRPCAKSQKIEFTVSINDAPPLLFPTDKSAAALNDKGRMLVKWKKTGSETEYQYSKDANFLNIAGSGKSKSQVAYIKPEKGDCFFRLRKKGSSWGRVYSFTVLPQKPGIPVIVYPYNRKIIKKGNSVFKWNETRGAEGYVLELSMDKKFRRTKKHATTGTELSLNLPNGNFYWRLSSYDHVNGKKRLSGHTKARLLIVKKRKGKR
ncbi:MAG: hypothetical protein JXA66_06140 [Oligoflexia bacterium]|nr:hypothetical protein [Oligoflexia bacterium]